MELITEKKLKFPSINVIHSSAGSGKTYQLVERYIDFILLGKKNTDFSNIVAITFTENASKEMRERIILKLKSLANNNDKNDELSKKALSIIDEILDRYYYFNVRTIDSFVLSIFRSKAIDLNFKTDFEVVFNYNEVLNEAFARFLSKVEDDKKLYEEFESVVDFLNSTSRDFFLNPLPKIEEIFLYFLSNEDKYLLDIKPFEEKNISEKQKIEKKIIELVDKVITKTSGRGVYVDILKGYDSGSVYDIASTVVEKESVFIRGNIPEGFEKISNEIIKLSYKWLIYEMIVFYQPYVEFYEKFRNFFDDYLKKSQKIVLSRTAKDVYIDLLKNKSVVDIYLKLSSFMKHFLIDEFQDTSLGQWSVIRPFVEEAISSDGSGFFIGDIKQAIYMFRNADYRIMFEFLNKRSTNSYINTESIGSIDVYDIKKNYRTDKKILEYVDSIFSSNIFKEYLKDYLPEKLSSLYQIKHIPDSKNDGYYKTILISKTDNFEDEIKEKILEIIKDVIKRYPYSSVAVLTYKNEQVEKISSWISEIAPVASYSSLDVRKNLVVSSIISFLKFLDSGNYFSFFEFINSDVFKKKYGVFYKSILEIYFNLRDKKERKYIFEKELEKLYPQFYKELILQFKNDSLVLNVYELLIKIYRFFEVYKNFPEFSLFLLKFAEIIYGFSIENYSLNKTIKMLNDNDDESFSIELSPSVDSIKVMTFHKAKGLGFDVVINVFWEGKSGYDEGMHFVPAENLYVLKINKSHSKALEKSDYKNILDGYESVKFDEAISKINLFYVAMTRAKKELYNIVYVKLKDSILKVFEDENIEKEGGRKYEESISKKKDLYLDIDFAPLPVSYPFVKEPDTDDEIKIKGRVIHRALSMIKKSSDFKDISLLIKKSFLIEEVSYNDDIFNEVYKVISEVLKDKNFVSFFEGDIKEVLNESEIISDDGKVFRPDRVVIREKSIDIVDFKSGGFDEKHLKQVKDYIKRFLEMYPEKEIYGYLYYVNEKKCIRVYEKD